MVLALILGGVAVAAHAIDFRAVAPDAAVLYDAPSLKAAKLFILSRGYPVEVLVALEGWSKVRDATGALAWIEAKHLTDKRTVMVRVPRAEVRQAPDEASEIVFYAEQDVVFDLLEMVGNYARVRHADGSGGYVRITQVWGS